MLNFFCFNEMDYQFQPENSNWCWAACLSNMIIGLNSNSSIGETQCDLVNHYKKIINESKKNACLETCCSENISPSCNLRLDDNDLVYMFEKSGFKIDTYDDISKLKNYEFIVKTLKDKQAPIILKTILSGSAHMVLINGYGTKNDGCNYILISNPDNSYKEIYYNHEHFFNTFNVEKFWTADIDSTNLDRDKNLDFNYNFIEKALQKMDNKDLIKNTDLLNPWTYLNDNNVDFFLNIYNNGININKLNDYNFKNLRYTMCNPYQNRDLISIGNIEYINEEKLIYINNEVSLNSNTYFKEYAIYANLKFKDKALYIQPKKYPKNYKLKEKDYLYSDFLSELEKINTSKVSSFLK